MINLGRLGLLFLLVLGAASASKAEVYKSAAAKQLIRSRDYLGFRIWVIKAYSQPVSFLDWYEVKNIIARNIDKTGFDLIQLWNEKNPRGKSDIDEELERADELMLKKKFEESFKITQDVAKKLKASIKKTPEARDLLFYVYHMMGRSLFGAKRFDEAMEVYQWITPIYPQFKQVLFEKMWAGFKGGRVDIALGAIASQHSAYFSKYLSPESYLLQFYLLKKLCRYEDAKKTVLEIKAFQESLKQNNLEDWSQNDLSTRTLLRLATQSPGERALTQLISIEERKSEQAHIMETLNKSFQRQKKSLLNSLETVAAYAHLAQVADTKTLLKPVQKLTSRDELLKKDLEVWPADGGEEWIDEIGKHIFIGESQCEK